MCFALARSPVWEVAPFLLPGGGEMDLQALFDAVVALVLLAWAYDGVKVIACHNFVVKRA
jgi:hypothetical protein